MESLATNDYIPLIFHPIPFNVNVDVIHLTVLIQKKITRDLYLVRKLNSQLDLYVLAHIAKKVLERVLYIYLKK